MLPAWWPDGGLLAYMDEPGAALLLVNPFAMNFIAYPSGILYNRM
jgi:hypothetical protein